MKKALITGITGQDGSFLAEFLLAKGYDVHGTIRRSSVDYRERIAHLEGHPHFHLHYADLGDSMSILQVVKKVKPNEIYNLAAQSHVQVCSIRLNLRRCRCHRRIADLGSCPPMRLNRYLPHLSGFDFRTLRQGGRSSSK